MKRLYFLILFFLGITAGLFARTECSINELVVEQLACENGLFYVVLNFNVNDPAGDLFGVNGNGNDYGTFPYDSLPITLGPLEGDGVTEWEFNVYDVNNPDCHAVYNLGPVSCNMGDCEIFNVTAEVGACENGHFFVTLNFNYQNVSDHFIVTGNGNNYGTFEYGNLPVLIGPLEGNGMVYEFVVHDSEFDGCTDFVVIDGVQCEQDCGFNEINVDPVECQGDGYYRIGLNFNHFGTGDLFTVYTQGMSLGSYAYADLPVFIDSFPSSCGAVDVLTICDNADSSCCATREFTALQCCAECEIYDLVVETTECDSSGQFYVVLNFEYMNVSDDGFYVHGNGNNYGSFGYGELPLTLGPFIGDGSINYEFAATDLGDGSCSDGTSIGLVNCSCGFDAISVDPLECTGNGTYSLMLNFVPVGVTNDGFDVYAGNEFVGFYLYADLPVVVENFPDNDGIDVITICDNDNPTCCTSYEFEGLYCTCNIYDLVAEAFDCDTTTNTFALYIDFNWTGSDHFFKVYKGNVLIETIDGNNLPDTLYGLTDDGGGALIKVCAHEFPDCCEQIEISVPQCGIESCNIWDLVAEASECHDSTQTFSLFVDFNWSGSVHTFKVFKDNVLIGTVDGNNLPATIDGLTDDGGIAHIKVCAQENNDCCATVEITVPQCGEEPCDIWDLVAEASECNDSTQTFNLTINFNWSGSIHTFHVFKDNVLIGTVDGNNLPATIDGLTDDGGVAHIKVCAQENNDCCETIEITVPQCGIEPCDIWDLVAEAFACDDSTQTFALYIDFNWTGNIETFKVFKDNVLIGTVNGNHLPDTLYGLTDNGGGALIKVCAIEHPDCCDQIEISVPECGACEIYEVNVDTGECTGDSTFTVAITFLYTGFMNEFVDIWTGDNYLGIFNVNEQPIVINNFPWNGHEVMPLKICQNDHPECCKTVEFAVPDCLYGQECGIFELEVIPIDCVTDSTFAAFVNYVPVGFDGPVQIWAGSTYLGVYPQIIPLLLTNIPEHDGGIIIKVCKAEDPECCAQVEIQGLSCENVCAIDNLTATLSDCLDGMFTVTLNFDYENEGPGFIVLGNTEVLGTFTYDQLPVTVGPLPGDNETFWLFAVADLGNIVCADVVEVGVVDCTTGIFSGPAKTLPLDVLYGSSGAEIVIPEHATLFSIWTYDGRLIASNNGVKAGDHINLDQYTTVPGLYLVQVRTDAHMYVGKVIGY